MGSSDSYGRQLDGMDAGISSLSKICIVDRSERSDADVNYTFIGIGIERDEVDMAGNCGNTSSAIEPYLQRKASTVCRLHTEWVSYCQHLQYEH